MPEKINLPPNSFKNTFCVFQEVEINEIKDLTVEYQSKSGSIYYYTKNGMYRLSNHWGRLANSKWRLMPLEAASESKKKLGFAYWTDFHHDNRFEKLYYIEVNFVTKKANYQHINNQKKCNNMHDTGVIRTSGETKKRLKQVRNILELNSWQKHFNTSDLESLRKSIINDLIFTDKPLDEIKKSYLK